MLVLLPMIVALLPAVFIEATSPSIRHSQEVNSHALETVVNNVDFNYRDLANLMLVNKEARDSVQQKPVWKYMLATTRKRKSCLQRFFLKHHNAKPSQRNPVKYLFLFKPGQITQDRNLQNDIYCLNEFAAKGIPVEIVTCQDVSMRHLRACSSFHESSHHAQLMLSTDHVPVTFYNGPNDVGLAKRLLLTSAIRMQQHHLIEYLLTPDPEQQTPISRESMVEALYIGNETLFYRLIEPFLGNTTSLREMLVIDVAPTLRNYFFRDMASMAIKNSFYRDYMPSSGLLDFLFTHIPLSKHHFEAAALCDQRKVLEYLIQRAKKEMSSFQLNRILSGTLKFAAASNRVDILEFLLQHITDFNLLSELEQDMIVQFALRADFLEKKWYLLKGKLNIKIHGHHIIDAMAYKLPIDRVLWLVRHCEWDLSQDVVYFFAEVHSRTLSGVDYVDNVVEAVERQLEYIYP